MGKRKNRILEGKHERAGLRLIKRAIHNGWDIPEELMSQLPRVVTGLIANAKTDRERLRAIEVIVAMQRDNLSALVAADRIERLEEDKPTDRIVLEPITLRVGGGG